MKNNIKNITYTALSLALCMVLPFLTGQIKEIGDSLLPMHLPVLLCGFLCGWPYGLLVGLIAPYLRSILFGMPPFYPNALWMALELATYGFVSGLLYKKFSNCTVKSIYLSLIPALLAGRVVLAIAKAILLTMGNKTFILYDFFMGSVVDALPGILLQLILIPVLVRILTKETKQ